MGKIYPDAMSKCKDKGGCFTLNIRAVVDLLNKELNANISAEYYSRIEYWGNWWRGKVDTFHVYREMLANGGSKKRELYTMGMAKKVCEDWAAALLNEKTEITIDDESSNNYLNGSGGVFERLDFWNKANALVEKAFYSGTGAFVLKLDGLTGDEDGRIEPTSGTALRMEFLPAQCIIPLSHRNGSITEAAFVSDDITVRGKHYIYVELHLLEDSGYVIENRYYEAQNEKLIPAPLPKGIVPKFITGSSIPFFAIMHPNIVNPYKDNNGLGCSVFAQAISNLKGLDRAFNNFCRDFELGGKKVFYSQDIAKQTGVTADGTPMYITPDDVMQQLFVSVGDSVNLDEKAVIYEFNPELRVKDNADGVQAMMDYLSFKCGFGAKHYRFDTSSANVVTATQYTGEKQDLRQNAAKHSLIVDKALKSIIRAVLWAGKNILGLPVNPDALIEVKFSDGYIISDEEKRKEDREDLRDFVLQPWEYRMRWYGEDEATAKSMTQAAEPMFGGRKYPPGEDE